MIFNNQKICFYVGDASVGSSLKRTIEATQAEATVTIPPHLLAFHNETCEDDRETLFPPVRTYERDLRILLMNQKYLVPHPLRMDQYAGLLSALLPKTSAHFLSKPHSAYGIGFSQIKVAETVQHLASSNLPYTKALTPIEGGNCHLFQDKTGQSKAIVGIHTLLLTWILFNEKDTFKYNNENKFTQKNKHISDSFIKLANKLDLFRRGKKISTDVDESIISSADSTLLEQAHSLRKTFEICAQAIAHDLRVERKYLAIVPQARFHIDMDLFVDPTGEIVYAHDDDLLMPSMDKTPSPFSNEIYKEKLIKTVAAIGCKVIFIPGVFSISRSIIANFMNGIWTRNHEGSLFITNGSTDTTLEQQFTALMKTHGVAVAFVASGKPLMPGILQNFDAGLRCLSVEIL